MTLLELIEKASQDLCTYRHADVDEVQQRLHEILQAAGLGGIENDRLNSLEIYEGNVAIDTSWSARGSENFSSYSIPVSIIEASDPIKEATIYGLELKIKYYSSELATAHIAVQRHEERLAEYQTKLSAISRMRSEQEVSTT